MSFETLALAGTAAAIAFVHTIAGPDHYLPFVGLARAQGWSRKRTLWITTLCGLGHLASSFLLGLIGLALGLSLDVFESLRGSIAAWGLIGFGLLYGAWGLRRALQGREHAHWHAHADSGWHRHLHSHHKDHLHVHTGAAYSGSVWALLTIFLLGPCEPLIPLMLVPAAGGQVWELLAVCGAFSFVTIFTMQAAVIIGTTDTGPMKLRFSGRYAHVMAGALLCLCGVAIEFGGL